MHKKPSKREVDAFHKEADERFKRLSVVATVLRGPQRERYDFFLQNGFPAWKGTGYYYRRYRPGLGTVVVGLLIFGGGFAHYGIMHISYRRQRDFMHRYIRHARQVAWGNNAGVAGIPGLNGPATPATGFESAATTADEQAQGGNRRQKRMQAKEDRKAAKNPKASKAAKEKGVGTPPVEAEVSSAPQGAKKRVVAENGKVLIVDSVGNVYLEEETEEGQVHEFLLDVGRFLCACPATSLTSPLQVDEIPKPSFSNTFMVRLPKWAYRKSVGRVLGQAEEVVLGEDVNAGSPEDAIIKQATAANQNGEARKRKLGPR